MSPFCHNKWNTKETCQHWLQALGLLTNASQHVLKQWLIFFFYFNALLHAVGNSNRLSVIADTVTLLQHAYRCPHKPDWCRTKLIGTTNSPVCVWCWDQNYIKLLSASHKPLSPTMTKADQGLMIQTTLGYFALYKAPTIKRYSFSNTKLAKLHDSPVRLPEPFATLFCSTLIYLFIDSLSPCLSLRLPAH